ncbi:MAG: hypothetical protein STSR0009_26360 [Methanoregula sp.]
MFAEQDARTGNDKRNSADDERKKGHCCLEHAKRDSDRKGVDARCDGQTNRRFQLDYFDRDLTRIPLDSFYDHLHADYCEEQKRNPVVVGGDEPEKGHPISSAGTGHHGLEDPKQIPMIAAALISRVFVVVPIASGTA